VIAALLTGDRPVQAGLARELRLAGARISGPLILALAVVDRVASFEQCLFDAGVDMSEATMRSVRFRGCILPHLEARRITLHGELAVEGCQLDWLSLYAAHVTEVEVSGQRYTTRAAPRSTATCSRSRPRCTATTCT